MAPRTSFIASLTWPKPHLGQSETGFQEGIRMYVAPLLHPYYCASQCAAVQRIAVAEEMKWALHEQFFAGSPVC